MSIRRSPAVTDEGLDYLKQLPALTNLGLLEVGITDGGLARCVAMSRLRALDLRGCSQVGNPGLRRLAAIKRLQVLRLGGYAIDDESLAIVGKSGSLISLTIDDASITDAGLAKLAGLPLEELNLARCFSITDDGFQQLAALGALRQLSIRGIPISGAGLVHLRRLRALAALRLNETGVNDNALAALAEMKNLTRLELRQTLITDAAADRLAHRRAALSRPA